MPRKLPPHCVRQRDRHGKVKFYFRRGKGARIRLPDPEAPDFLEAYAAAASGTPRKAANAHSGTLAWLIARYKESGSFAALSPGSRRERDHIYRRVEKSAGDIPFTAIERKHIVAAMESRKPAAANNFRAAMSRLFQWALEMGFVPSNPVDGTRPVKVRSDGHHVWTVEEVLQFWERWPLGTYQRLAMDLFLFTGLRIGDVHKAGRQHISNGVLSLQTQKTGAWANVPVFPILQASIDACPAGTLAFLVTERGVPFASSNALGTWFAKACKAAGVPGRAHGLRKAGATIAAENGATAHQLMSMFTWDKMATAETYTRKADRKRLATGAGEQIANAFAPHLAGGEGFLTKTR
jgi:integrase